MGTRGMIRNRNSKNKTSFLVVTIIYVHTRYTYDTAVPTPTTLERDKRDIRVPDGTRSVRRVARARTFTVFALRIKNTVYYFCRRGRAGESSVDYY